MWDRKDGGERAFYRHTTGLKKFFISLYIFELQYDNIVCKCFRTLKTHSGLTATPRGCRAWILKWRISMYFVISKTNIYEKFLKDCAGCQLLTFGDSIFRDMRMIEIFGIYFFGTAPPP